MTNPNPTPYTSNADAIRRAAVVRWATVSIAAGGVGTAFMPAAFLGGGDWATNIEAVAPLWALFCLAGMASGLRAMYLAGRRKTIARPRALAATGAILSLLSFLAMTIIALIGGQ